MNEVSGTGSAGPNEDGPGVSELSTAGKSPKTPAPAARATSAHRRRDAGTGITDWQQRFVVAGTVEEVLAQCRHWETAFGCQAWRDAHDAVQGIGKRQSGTVSSLTDANRSDCVAAMQGFWQDVYKPGDNHAVLSGLENICAALARACDGYAQKIDDAHSKIKDAMIGAAAAIFGTSLLGLLGSIFTAGISDEAAAGADVAEAEAILGPVVEEAVTATETEVAAAIAEDLVPAVDTAATEAPTVTTVEAETGEVETALDEELAATEGKPPPDPEQIPTPGGRPGTLDDLNPQQLSNYKRYLSKIPKNARGDDIAFSSDDLIDHIAELANPLLYRPLNRTAIHTIHDQLDTS